MEVYVTHQSIEVYDRNGTRAAPALVSALQRWGLKAQKVYASPCG
ncbi:MAG: hypothetical protein AB1445_11210 [Bacillota bacterium]